MNLIMSGSITSGYGIQPEVLRWPDYLAKNPLNEKFEIATKDGLTYEEALGMLRLNNFRGEILILYFGTRVGWPRISKNLATFFPKLSKNERYLELSAFRSTRKFASFRRGKKIFFRNFAKFIGIFLNQYRPDIPLKKCLTDLDLLFAESTQRFKRVIFLQHHHLNSNRLRYENSKYDKFYNSILSFASERFEKNLIIVELPSDIFSSRYFLSDCVHFNLEGHKKMGNFLSHFLATLEDKQ